MEKNEPFYAVYVSPLTVEIISYEQSDLAKGRFVCRQANYSSLLRFARNLALQYRLTLHNHVQAKA